MDKFEGTPGAWDIDINGQTILSDAGYKVADIDLIHGSDSDVAIMVAAPELLEALQKLRVYAEDVCGVCPDDCHEEHPLMLATSAITKPLGK
ncbi:hypothetical protein GP938_23295 [Escherichia coli]|nr:hypothetical protein [Escherichia coli]